MTDNSYIKISLILIILFTAVNLRADNNLNENILGSWRFDEKILNALKVTTLTFKTDNKFLYVIEESVGENKALSNSEGTYSIKDDTITMEYKSFEGRPMLDKDSQSETFYIHITNNLMGFPAYKIVKSKNDALGDTYFTKTNSFSKNSKYAFEVKQTTEETIFLKSDSTVSLVDEILSTQKGMVKNKESKVIIEKTGKYRKDKDIIIVTFTKSTIDNKTSQDNPEIKKFKIVKEKNIALINPFIKVK
ncbi:MAG: hypothetical protein HY934_04795 [Candidatus Firestonebacteria bacterium]|nr:hypothetical protein [Candidatus Firestonebacteria bacterium]